MTGSTRARWQRTARGTGNDEPTRPLGAGLASRPEDRNVVTNGRVEVSSAVAMVRLATPESNGRRSTPAKEAPAVSHIRWLMTIIIVRVSVLTSASSSLFGRPKRAA